MSFRSNFYLPGPPGVTPGEQITINTLDKGLTANYEQNKQILLQLERQDQVSLRLLESQEMSSQLIGEEIRYQTMELREAIENLSSDITSQLEAVGDYLGAEIAQVRWALDRNTEVTRHILDVQFRSHWHDSRQYYEEGVQCFDAGEKEIAKEQFEKAVAACRTNSFAYQHLGFIAVDADDEQQALRNFELAMKFAPDARQRAYAYYHLARGWFAAGDLKKALECIQQAVEQAPDSKTYQYELIHALARIGNTSQAVVELRKLIEVDWNYWSLCAADPLLDSIRADVTRLLSQMREEQRVIAANLISRFNASIQLIESFNQADDKVILGTQPSSAKESYSRFAKLQESGVVFAYREIIEKAPIEHDAIIQQVVNAYEGAIGQSREHLGDAERSYDDEEEERKATVYSIRASGEDKLSEAKDGPKVMHGCLWAIWIFLVVPFFWTTVTAAISASSGAYGGLAKILPLILIMGIPSGIMVVAPLVLFGKHFVARLNKRREGEKLLREADAAERERLSKDRESGEALTKLRVSCHEFESLSHKRIQSMIQRLMAKEDRDKKVLELAPVKEELHEVTSPISGIFRESRTSGTRSYVRAGDRVKVGQILCIVEAMNLMNEIESDVAGEVIERLVFNSQVVEFGQPLFLIRRRY